MSLPGPIDMPNQTSDRDNTESKNINQPLLWRAGVGAFAGPRFPTRNYSLLSKDLLPGRLEESDHKTKSTKESAITRGSFL